jgi:hypothetical protein
MFNKHALEVKMIKSRKPESNPSQPEEGFKEKVEYLTKSLKPLAKEMAKFIVLYIALDTARQVVVTHAQHKY